MTQNTPHHDTFFPAPKAEKQYSPSFRRNAKAFILFILSGAYALIVMAALYAMIRHSSWLPVVTLYICGMMAVYAVMLLNKSYSDAIRSRLILTETLEKSPEARVITMQEGEIVYANEAFTRLIRASDKKSLESFARIFPDAAKAEKQLQELQSKAAPAGSATTEMPTEIAGKPVWFLVTCQFTVGMPGYVSWRFDDITHRHAMEAEIREEREKLRDFTDNAPVGFFTIDSEGKFRFANDTLLRLLGTDAKTVIGRMKLHDILVAPPVHGNPYDFFEDGGMHQHGETLMRGAGGRVFKAAITHSIMRDEERNIISRSVVYDLTTEQRIQQALRESEDRFERLFEEAPVGICLLTAAGLITDANQTLATMLRLPVDAINSKPLLHFIREDMHAKMEEWLRHLSKGEKAAPFIEISLKGSVEVVAQLYARKFKSGASFVLHFIDITDQKNLEKQFNQSQKMQAVGQLAGGVAHDFNNLLTAMIGFCDLLLLRHKPGDSSFADIMQIKQNANRAANLVRQLLAFSRQQTLQPRILDMTDVLSEISHLLRRLIGANIEMNVNHGSDLGLIKADQGQMDQVLINLVVNARDAMPKGGKVSIRTQNLDNPQGLKLSNDEVLPAGSWVTIRVEDTGTGIPPDVLPRIFEPFFSTKEVGAGTGLGLATVHGIVHQTGGYISVESTIGVGTAFTLYLPRHTSKGEEKSVEVSEEKASPSDLTGTARILLVEDEDAVRTFSTRALTNKGYQVVDAPGGLIALKLLEEKKIEPEILITDVMMPEMDGTTLAKEVREKYPKIKIIFISGYAEDRFKEHLGADVWFLPKPFTLKQLAMKVKEVLEA